MPFMNDFQKAMHDMRAMMDQLNDKMMRLEDIIHEHFDLARKPTPPLPPRMMADLEKEVMK